MPRRARTAFPMSDVVVGAVVGAVAALMSQALWQKVQSAHTARSLAAAFWEELSAIEFVDSPTTGLFWAGFSSQVFDTMFREIADTLPSDLSTRLMRYHWRMKVLVEQNADTYGGVACQAFIGEAREMRDLLLRDLASFRKLSATDIAFSQ